MNKKFKTGIFIVGVRKSGTTTLYDILAKHSEIQIGKFKEPQFFCLPRQTVEENMDWYTSLFPKQASIILDGSAFYYQLPESLDLINEYFEQAYFILCLRNPVKRFYSAYWHMRGKPQGVEKRSLQEIIDGIKGEGVEEILEKERQFISSSAKNKKIGLHYQDEGYHQRTMDAPFSSAGLPPSLPFEYYKESLYSLHYSRFAAHGETHVVMLEQLVQDPQSVLFKLHQFLGLPPETATIRLSINRNSGKEASSASILQYFSDNKIYAMLKKYSGAAIKSRVRKFFNKPVPQIQTEEYQQIRELLREEFDFWVEKYPDWGNYWYRSSNELKPVQKH